ncbi:SCA7, zinc-binding domain-containing protein [Irpex lacteus]|nr:SCA7, zinc-binding domain-containing protein [Irpex lacteus]
MCPQIQQYWWPPVPSPDSPFAWDKLPSSPSAPDTPSDPPSPPTQWLSAKDMKIFGASPLSSTVGLVRCRDCEKPVMRSAMAEHAESCAKIRAAERKAGKGKTDLDINKNKKRKAEDDEPTPEDPSAPKKKKAATKVTKGRVKGPVDLDQHCGVINDKGLPCSRSLTCKTHSMGAKQPQLREPVKRESKAAKKERKEKEKAEKKKAAQEAAIAAGLDPSGKKSSGTGGGATASSVEDIDDVDSEEELDHLSTTLRLAQDRGIMSVPLAVPADSSSWFVGRRERIRTCRELLATALIPSRPSAVGVTMGPGRI